MGVTLIAAAIVIPAIVARLLTDSFSTMLWLSTLIGVLTGVAGVFASVVFGISSGATIVLVSALLFVLVLGGTMQARRRDHRRAVALQSGRQPSRAASIAGLFD
jgi:ABC-type Mn2+/Zn2+ transport system permease subunit